MASPLAGQINGQAENNLLMSSTNEPFD